MPIKTKIIATVGPASDNKEMLTSLINAGVNVFRLNFSHGTHDQHAKVIDTVAAINQELGTNIGILADLQGPKIRLGEVENGQIELKTGSTITVTSIPMISNSEKIYVSYQGLATDMRRHERILIDDGTIELRVKEIANATEVKAEVIYGGLVTNKKGVNLPDTTLEVPALTPKDIADLEFILSKRENPVNWIALSFVRTPEEIQQLKGMIRFKSHLAKVIAKIEKPEALQNIDEIIKVSDAIMVARGDLGVEIPLERVPVLQKELIDKCIVAAKPVIIATQMMESMIKKSMPTRAEVTDVATAITEGTDAVMLSAETAIGKYPIQVIQTMVRVINTIEKQNSIYNRKHKPSTKSPTFLSDAVCYNACRIAESVNAKVIIGMTLSGYTAFLLSSFRPNSNIYIFTKSRELLNSVSLIWGVKAFFYDSFVSTDETISDVQEILKKQGLIAQGDIVINTGSMPLHQRGRTNTIKVSRV